MTLTILLIQYLYKKHSQLYMGAFSVHCVCLANDLQSAWGKSAWVFFSHPRQPREMCFVGLCCMNECNLWKSG